MNVDEHFWWYLSRASGMVAWLALSATCLWGILLITRMLKPADRPAWLLDLHRYLGLLAVVFTVVHLLGLVADNFVHFGFKELFIPIICGVFVVESLSVILQVGWFKFTRMRYGEGRRIFLMAPLHHHYQKKGYAEPKIVIRFLIIGLLLAVITVVTLKIR